jgi:hypothetical protein
MVGYIFPPSWGTYHLCVMDKRLIELSFFINQNGGWGTRIRT